MLSPRLLDLLKLVISHPATRLPINVPKYPFTKDLLSLYAQPREGLMYFSASSLGSQSLPSPLTTIVAFKFERQHPSQVIAAMKK